MLMLCVIIVVILVVWLVVLRIVRLVFFFSSRRRHTRCSRDWSSDVCSSDLRMRPNRPGDQHHGDKGQPDFRSRYAQPVRFRLSCEDVSKIRIEASSKGHKRAERAGNVEIKNLLDYTHGPFDGRVIESEVPGDGNQNEKDGRLERTFHQSRLP